MKIEKIVHSAVIGIGYGDEAKGVVTKWLLHRSKKSLVVRFSGGHQVGHTVALKQTDDNIFYHTAVSFGAGVLDGVPVYMTENTVVYPTAAVNEFQSLIERLAKSKVSVSLLKKMNPRIYLHPLTKICTPFDIAYNRALPNLHGSVGVGFNATLERHKTIPLYAIDLKYPEILQKKVEEVFQYYLKIASSNPDIDYWKALGDIVGVTKTGSVIVEYFMEDAALYMEYILGMPLSFFNVDVEVDNYVYEGNQGIMLDKNYGYNPYTTPCSTTSKAISSALDETYYVMRSYSTRHGKGPFNRASVVLNNAYKEGNAYNDFQEYFKTGVHSLQEVKYALEVDGMDNKDSLKYLVVSCVDQTENKVFFDVAPEGIHISELRNFFKEKVGVEFSGIFVNSSPLSETIVEI